MDGIYSQLKPAWHLDRIQALRDGRMPVPVHVELILSDLCNHDCDFCAYRMSSGLSNELFPDAAGATNPNRRIPTEKAREIIEDCGALGVKAMQFTGGGEPTVHPDHLALFALAQQVGMKTALVTNGVKLNPAHEAVQAMTWVRVSVDAGTAQTYAKVRRVSEAHFHKAWGNIEQLARTCRGVVSVGYVVTPDNFAEIRLAAERARDAGVANMRIGAVFSSAGASFYGGLDLQQVREEIARAKELEGEGFTIGDLFDRRIGDLGGSPEEPLCGYQFLQTYIGGDLGVYRCCNTAYTRHGKMASLVDRRFRDVFGPGQTLPEFDGRSCRYCQFLGQNKLIAGLVREPMHAEFV